jgi:hypothetical protein
VTHLEFDPKGQQLVAMVRTIINNDAKLAITLIKCQLYSFLSGQAWEGGFNEKMLRAAISN